MNVSVCAQHIEGKRTVGAALEKAAGPVGMEDWPGAPAANVLCAP